MKWGIYIVGFIYCGVAAYYITRFLLKKFVGEVFYMDDENGRRHRILKRPNERLVTALGRLKNKMKSQKESPMQWGILFRWHSCWVGVHWSPYNKRLCINLVPFVTVWITAQGGGNTGKRKSPLGGPHCD